MNIDMEKAAQIYESLSDQEKEIIREAVDSPLMGILSKVFGEEFVSALGTFQRPQRKMNAEMREQAARVLMG
tara:strand:+ start:995 stop:1210 length:216 start_codon:yes stop_codon:yes gene_type:complete